MLFIFPKLQQKMGNNYMGNCTKTVMQWQDNTFKSVYAEILVSMTLGLLLWPTD